MTNNISPSTPLAGLDEWEDDLLKRYPNLEDIAASKTVNEYRNYEESQRDTVKEFYRLNHINHTFDFVMQKREQYLGFNKKE